MLDLNNIWKPIEVFTLTKRLLFIKLENKYNNIHLDSEWEKIMGDDSILFEFNPGESKNFDFIGTLNECIESPELLDDILDTTPKYEEVWNTPSDIENWERIEFRDANNKPFKLMNKDCKYRRIIGNTYIHYGVPADVRDDLPLSTAVDSLTTLIRPKGIYSYADDYIILKDKKYKTQTDELLTKIS